MPKLPQSIGKYKVESLIAKGGMGAVYKAIHPTLRRPVIIKKLTLRGRKDINERFKREARILMDIRHDGVVDVYDHFRAGSSYYIVLEYLDGGSLDDVLKRERYLDNGTAAYILYNAACALHYAHEKKVVHRDIKPANLLLSKAGEIKLVDFGIAASDEDAEEGLTRDGMTLGTPSYMAPEQFQDSKNVDRRADIYSLGVLAYEMLTGKKPFPGSFSAELMADIQKGKYPNPRKYNPRIHPVLLRFISKAMKPKSERRDKDLTHAIRDLERYLRGYDKTQLCGIVAGLAAGKEPVKPTYRKKRHPVLKVLIPIAAGILLAAAGAFFYITGYHNEILRGDSFGAAVFSVRTDARSRPWYRIFVRAELFQDDNTDIPALPKKRVVFFKVREDGREDTWLFRSLPLYLPLGAYRAKVHINNSVHWHAFVIDADSTRQLNPFTAENKVIISTQLTAVSKPLSVSVEASNIITGNTIGDGAETAVFLNGDWTGLTRAAGDLTTGNVYRFRISHKEYHTKTFSLLIREDQDILRIQASLVPLPGRLELTREHEGMRFSLNGSQQILSADEVPVPLDLNGESGFTGNIPPGMYELHVQYKRTEAFVPLEIVQGETVTVHASFDPDTGESDLVIQ